METFQLVGFKSSEEETDYSVAGKELVDKGKEWKKWSMEFDDTAKIELNGQKLTLRKGRILNFDYDCVCKSIKFLEDGKGHYFFAGY